MLVEPISIPNRIILNPFNNKRSFSYIFEKFGGKITLFYSKNGYLQNKFYTYKII